METLSDRISRSYETDSSYIMLASYYLALEDRPGADHPRGSMTDAIKSLTAKTASSSVSVTQAMKETEAEREKL
jgi:hypothetical protein